MLKHMQANGIKANIIAYSCVARAFARVGKWAMVESLQQQLEKEGLQINEYFLYALLDAYGHGKPRQPQRAEAAFRDAMAKGLQANEHVLSTLARVLGRRQALELAQELACP